MQFRYVRGAHAHAHGKDENWCVCVSSFDGSVGMVFDENIRIEIEKTRERVCSFREMEEFCRFR